MAAYTPPQPTQPRYTVLSTGDVNTGSEDYKDMDAIPPPGFGQHVYCPGNQQGRPYMVTSGQHILVVQPIETGTPPNTQAICGLVVSVLVTLLCAWPCGIGAIVSNGTARGMIKAGQYTKARSFLSKMWGWIAGSVTVGIICWIYIAVRITAMFNGEFQVGDTDNNYIN